jgi:hypothetical protein
MSDLKHITKCKHCGKEFIAPALAVPIIGEPPTAHVLRYVEVLMKHLATKHQTEWPQLLGVSSLLTGVMILRQFESADPALVKAEDVARFQVHQLTRRNPPPTDEDLDKKIDAIGLDHRADVVRLMRELRDYLIEAAVFQPVNAEPS